MGSEAVIGKLPLEQCEPTDWFVVFHPESHRPWLNWLACGRFKHVSAFGWVERAQTWLFFDFNLDRSRIYAVANHEANAMIEKFTVGRTVVRMAKPLGCEFNRNIAAGAWCVPAVAHLLGIRGCALRPDTLFRKCIAQGGEIIGAEGASYEAEDQG